ncbi:MAG: ribonucleoside-triphosphate reductase [Bacteroidaceae bacterium]|nr:ribonucleoside-triphosphate reductase [Bacteroidaceae bacterium]
MFGEGGDAEPQEVAELAAYIRSAYPSLRTAWYSGRQQPSEELMDHKYYDYVKVGPYIKAKGPLNSPTTNQRLYRIDADNSRTDLTSWFWQRRG